MGLNDALAGLALLSFTPEAIENLESLFDSEEALPVCGFLHLINGEEYVPQDIVSFDDEQFDGAFEVGRYYYFGVDNVPYSFAAEGSSVIEEEPLAHYYIELRRSPRADYVRVSAPFYNEESSTVSLTPLFAFVKYRDVTVPFRYEDWGRDEGLYSTDDILLGIEKEFGCFDLD